MTDGVKGRVPVPLSARALGPSGKGRHKKLNMSCGDRRRITHVIFDVDGLLLGEAQGMSYQSTLARFLFLCADTESLYTETTQDICSQYGKTFDWSVKSRMMGRRPLEAAKMLVDALELPLSAEEFNSELYKRLTPRFPDAKLMPGDVIRLKPCNLD